MKHTKELTWQDVYKLPLKLDEYSSYAWADNGEGAVSLQFKNVAKESRSKIIDIINSTSSFKIEGVRNDGCDFYIGDSLLFYIRGWGHLTGTGALNLPQNKAIEIQDGFIAHVLKSLSV